MTVQSATNRIDYTTTAALLVYPYNFRILDETHLKVYLGGVLKTLATDYTVSGVGVVAGGNVTLTANPGAGVSLAIIRSVPITQLTDYVEHDPFAAETHEDALDKLTMIAQQQDGQLERTLRFAESSTAREGVVPDPIVGKYLKWSDTSPPTLENSDATDLVAATEILVPVTDFDVPPPLPVQYGGFGRDISDSSGTPILSAGTVQVLLQDADPNGLVDSTAAFSTYIAAAPAGSVLILPGGSTYLMSGLLTINKALTIFAYGVTFNWSTDAINQGIRITASNVRIYGATITGPQHATYVGTQIGVYAYGTDAANLLSGIILRDLTVSNWGRHAIEYRFVELSRVESCRLYDCLRGGVVGYNTSTTVVSDNLIYDIDPGDGSGNAYGVAFADDGTGTCAGNIIHANWIENIPVWSGVVLEPSTRTSVTGNVIVDCKIGIDCGSWSGGTNTSDYCLVQGNTILNLTLGHARYFALGSGGVDGTHLNTGCRVTNNLVSGYGTGIPTDFGACYFRYTHDLELSGNTILDSERIAIHLHTTNTNATVRGNRITGLASDGTNAAVAGIYLPNSGKDNSLIEANAIDTGTVAAMNFAVADRTVRVGRNAIISTHSGPVAGSANVAMDLYVSNVAYTTSGTGEDDLASAVIGAATMTQTGGLRVRAAGQKSGGNGNKTIKFHWGTDAYTLHPAANDVTDWAVTIEIWNTSTSIQRLFFVINDGTTTSTDYASGAQDTSANVTLKFTGECANAGDTILQDIFTVERL